MASQHVVTLYQNKPDLDVLRQGLTGDLLGLFEGPTRLEADTTSCDSPPRIILYMRNLWAWSKQDRKVFAREVRLTYLHELGHFLGLEEDDLARRNL